MIVLPAIVAILFVASSGIKAQSTLEDITDTELRKLINNEKYVVALFCPEDGKDEEKCEEYEAELAAIREDLVDSINAWVVKASPETEMKALYNPDPVPTIVFFRDRAPVLYDGPANEEVMLDTLYQFKDTCMQDLTDTSFEHLTQAASGATTGDWLVSFQKEDCEECHRLTARLETVACKLKGRMNVARMNRESTGAATGRRFSVNALPALLFFRLGKIYRYELEKFDVASLMSFVQTWYKNVSGEPVPLPKTPFDDLVQMCVDYIREYPLVCFVCVAIPSLLLLLFYFLMSGSDDTYAKTKTKKKAKKKDAAARKKAE